MASRSSPSWLPGLSCFLPRIRSESPLRFLTATVPINHRIARISIAAFGAKRLRLYSLFSAERTSAPEETYTETYGSCDAGIMFLMKSIGAFLKPVKRRKYIPKVILIVLGYLSFTAILRKVTHISTPPEPPMKPLPTSLRALEKAYYDFAKNSTVTPILSTPSIPGASRKCRARVRSYSGFTQSGQIQQPRYAIATYVSSSQFVASAAVALHSISLTGTHHARVAIVSPAVIEEDKIFLGHFAQVIEVNLIRHKHHISNERYRDTFTKLRLWQLVMYTKVLYIDADIVLLRSIDDLFDLPTWAVPMDAISPRYSTGMMLLHPSLVTFKDMMRKLRTTKISMELPDLLFLTEYHNNLRTETRNQVHLFSRWYQVYQEEFAFGLNTHLTDWQESITIYDHRIRSIHYPGAGKPWMNFTHKFRRFAPSFCANEEYSRPFPHEPQFLWYSMYSKMRLSYEYMNTNASTDLRPINLKSYLSTLSRKH